MFSSKSFVILALNLGPCLIFNIIFCMRFKVIAKVHLFNEYPVYEHQLLKRLPFLSIELFWLFCDSKLSLYVFTHFWFIDLCLPLSYPWTGHHTVWITVAF